MEASSHEVKLVEKDYVRNVRMIHLERFARMEGAEKRESSAIKAGEQFFSMFGHYDRMTCVKSPAILPDYRHQFLIKFPYTPDRVSAVISEQFFTLYELPNPNNPDNPGAQNFENDRDPFDYVSTEALRMPFLGVLLISVEIPMGREGDNITESYNQLLEELICTIRKDQYKVLRDGDGDVKLGDDPCLRLFLTYNCANLALVIRTDRLSDIYRVKKLLLQQKVTLHLTKSKEEIVINPSMIVTPLIACECPVVSLTQEMNRNPLDSDKLIERNKNMHFNIRFSVKTDLDTVEANEIGDIHEDIYDILGMGNHSITLTYEHYAKLYPYLYANRYHRLRGAEKFYNALTDRYPLDEKPENSVLQKLIQTIKEDNLRSVYERLRFNHSGSIMPDVGDDFRPQRHFVLEIKSENLNRYLLARISEAHRYVNYMSVMKNEYEKLITLIYDLWYSFFNLTQLDAYAVHGRIFVLQMKTLLDNIDQAVEKSLVHASRPDGVTRRVENPKMEKVICDNLHSAILSINDYNKMLQVLNQYNINAQSYEIQTRVNAEKYLLAYSSFLQEIFYLDRKNNEQSAQGILWVPLVTMDTKQTITKTNRLFVEKFEKDSKNLEYRFFDVKFAAYHSMADIYHAIPLLMHEVAHAIRYLPRKERNKDVIRFALGFISSRMAEFLLNSAHESQVRYLNLFTEGLAGAINDFLWKKIQLHSAEKIETWSLQTCQSEFVQWMNKLMYVDAVSKWKGGSYIQEDDYEESLFMYWENWYPELGVHLKALFNYMECRYITVEMLERPHHYGLNVADSAIYFNMVCRLLLDDEEIEYSQTQRELGQYHKWVTKWLVTNSANIDDKFDGIYALVKSLDMYIDCLTKMIDEYFEGKRPRHSYSDLFYNCGINFGKKEFNSILSNFVIGMVIGSVHALMKKFQFKEKELYKHGEDIFKTPRSMRLVIETRIKNKPANKSTSDYQKWEQSLTELIGIYERFAQLSRISHMQKAFERSEKGSLVTDLHKEIHDKYMDIYQKRGLDYYALSSRKNNHDFARLGINLETPDIFQGVFRQMVSGYGNILIKVSQEAFRLYEEIYADLSMCAGMGFSPFGYLRFVSNIHMREGSTFGKAEKDARLERINAVIIALLLEEKDIDSCTYSEVVEGCRRLRLSVQEYAEQIIKDAAEWTNYFYRTNVNYKEKNEIKAIAEDTTNSLNQKLKNLENKINAIIRHVSDYKSKNGFGSKSPISLTECDYFFTRIKLAMILMERAAAIELMAELHRDEEIPEYQKQMATVYRKHIKTNAWTIRFREKEPVVNHISRYYNQTNLSVTFERDNDGHYIIGKAETRPDSLYDQILFVSTYYGACRDNYSRCGYRDPNLPEEAYDRNKVDSRLEQWRKSIVYMGGKLAEKETSEMEDKQV